MNKEKFKVVVPGHGNDTVTFTLKSADVDVALRLMDESLYNPLALIGAKENIRRTVKIVDLISVPLLCRVLQLRGVETRVELVDETNEYIVTRGTASETESVRFHSLMYSKIVRELLTIAAGKNGDKAWTAIKTLTSS